METLVRIIEKFYDREGNLLECKGDLNTLYVKVNNEFIAVKGISPHDYNVQISDLNMFSLDTIEVLLCTLCNYYSMDIDLYDDDIILKSYKNRVRVIK